MPRRRRLKITTAVLLTVLAILGVLLWRPIQQARNVAAVQNSVQRDWEIDFGSQSTPPAMPRSLDSAAESLLGNLFKKVHGYNTGMSSHTQNREYIYQERFRGLFRDPIEFIGIYYAEDITDDLGAALWRFPQLRRFIYDDNEDPLPAEATWIRLCTWIRAMPKLDQIELGGGQLTDAAIAPLAGHPGLRKISINYGHLSWRCVATFATMPNLKKLYIEPQITGDNVGFSYSEIDAIMTALPNVDVDLP